MKFYRHSIQSNLKMIVVSFAILLTLLNFSSANPAALEAAQGSGDSSSCECNFTEIYDEHLRRNVGNCLVKDPKTRDFYCYVDRNSNCRDTKQSSRANGLFYSYEACDYRRYRSPGVAAANVNHG